MRWSWPLFARLATAWRVRPAASSCAIVTTPCCRAARAAMVASVVSSLWPMRPLSRHASELAPPYPAVLAATRELSGLGDLARLEAPRAHVGAEGAAVLLDPH